MAVKRAAAALAAFVSALLSTLKTGWAAAGVPQPWQLGLQDAATPVMAQMESFHNLLLVIIFAIAALVFVLLAIVIYRFNAKRNPTPRKFSHNTVLEMIWTGVPVIILIVIAIPSFKLLYYQDRTPEADMTLKAIGHQWYWTYEYPDHGNLAFDAIILSDEELEEGQPRLLATDNHVVLPVDTTIRVLVTADDVIHAWAVPSFGVKMDAVPGRLNETWIRIEREGIYYGQCSELCGVGHAYMPITVEAVSEEDFAEWIAGAEQEFARETSPEEGPVTVARAGIRK